MGNIFATEDNTYQGVGSMTYLEKSMNIKPVSTDAFSNNITQPFTRTADRVENTATSAVHTIENDFEDVVDGVKTFYEDDLKPFGSAMFKVLKFGEKTVVFIGDHPMLVASVVGVYGASKFINTVKQALN